MAELSALEELLLGGGYDAARAVAAGPDASFLGARLPLPQPGAPWNGVMHADGLTYQEVAQSLVAKFEEHRLQQVQVASALQQLHVLQQQQQELAQLQQQLQALSVPTPANPFQRSRTTDLESLGRPVPRYDMPDALVPSLAVEQAAALAAGPSAGFARAQGVMGQHNLPVRSFSSEYLVPGHRGHSGGIVQSGGSSQATSGSGKRPPLRQPSGLGPGRGRPADGGRRARYAATAKAPSWASADWHPMKAVLASGQQASGGTGVFLPHLAGDKPSAALSSPPSTSTPSGVEGGIPSSDSSVQSMSGCGSGSRPISRTGAYVPLAHMPADLLGAAGGVPCAPPGGAMLATGAAPGSARGHADRAAAAAAAAAAAGALRTSPLAMPLPPGAAACMADHEGALAASLASPLTHLNDAMKVVVEEPEAAEDCDYVSLAKELAELMSKQIPE